MIHVYLDLREGESLLPDGDGVDVANLGAAARMAVRAARDVMREDILSGRLTPDASIIVRSADGTILLEVPFTDAITSPVLV